MIFVVYIFSIKNNIIGFSKIKRKFITFESI